MGVSGRVAALLSGGIDSPVAACRLQKRGCEVEFVHFHSVPYLADTSQRKARALVERLVRHQFPARLWLVPFGEIQREVVLAVPAPLRVVVYRRLMARIAEGIARRTGALALVTGESLGQVASQTLENLARTTEVVGDAGPPAAHRHRQGGDHPGGPGDRDLRDLHRARPGLLHALRAEAPRDARGRRRRARQPRSGSTWRRLVEAGVAGAATETFRFPPAEAATPVSAGA